MLNIYINTLSNSSKCNNALINLYSISHKTTKKIHIRTNMNFNLIIITKKRFYFEL
jgi:hypothetical protein